MSTRVGPSVVGLVERVNAFQDRLVADYVRPHAVPLTYWAFGAVFLYLGLQKVVPHRSTADVPLSTIGGLVGVPYVEFVTAIGVWQMLIGALFLARRLRLAGVFFITYQVFTFGTLVVLRYIVFQPPWITVLGVDLPWALGAYSAFILKNTVIAGAFFVLAGIEVATSDERAATSEEGEP